MYSVCVCVLKRLVKDYKKNSVIGKFPKELSNEGFY